MKKTILSSIILVVLAMVYAGHTFSIQKEVASQVEQLHREALVWDAHSDIVQSILLQGLDFSKKNDFSFQDIPRMQQGGLDVQVLALLPDRIYFPRRSARRTLQLLEVMLDALEKIPDEIQLARSAVEIEQITKSGKIAAVLGIEGGHSIEDDLGLLRIYNRLGVTLMTLTHMNSNNWADAATGESLANGLSEFGQKVIREMNRLGMVIDISHSSDKTFYDVLKISKDPVIASHSNCRELCDHPRNLSDDMIKALAAKDGVLCLTTVPGYTTQEFKDARDQAVQKAKKSVEEKSVPEDLDVWAKQRRLTPSVMPDIPFPTLEDVLDHIDHAVKLVGVDYVGIGHDYSIHYPGPKGLEDVSQYQNITRGLVKRGYSSQDIKKILGGNLLRVWYQVTH